MMDFFFEPYCILFAYKGTINYPPTSILPHAKVDTTPVLCLSTNIVIWSKSRASLYNKNTTFSDCKVKFLFINRENGEILPSNLTINFLLIFLTI